MSQLPRWMVDRGLQPPMAESVQADGPGTELIAMNAEDYRIPPCADCNKTARKMNLLGPDGCRAQIEELIDEIQPRVKQWLREGVLSGEKVAEPTLIGRIASHAPDPAQRRVIKARILKAITRYEERQHKPPFVKRNGRPIDRHPPDLGAVTVVVKSFLRHDKLRRTLMSFRRHLPGVRVIVADDSLRPGESYGVDAEFCRSLPGVTWLQLPFDSGLSAGRNAAIAACETEWVLLTDDDHILVDNPLPALFDVTQNSQADIVCGCLWMHGRATSWSALLDEGNQKREIEWRITRDGRHWHYSTAFMNFFLCQTSTLRDVPWDDRLKVHEHNDHVYRVRNAGLKVACTPSAIAIDDDSPDSAGYRSFRSRSEFKRLSKTAGPPLGKNKVLPTIPLLVQSTDHSRIPNVIVFGVGHSGTTIVSQVLARLLRLNLGDVDLAYCEHRGFRDANNHCLRNGSLPGGAHSVLASLPVPWLLKDPRLVNTLEHWLPLLKDHDPLLLYLTRDREAIEASYDRRGEVHRQGLTLDETIELARLHYERWPWRKLTMSIERLAEVCAMVDPARVLTTASAE